MVAMSVHPELAERLKTETRIDHERAENSSFMKELLGGERSLADYTRYLGQYAHVYAALESRQPREGDPAFLTDPRLLRMPAIEHDLAALGVPNWRAIRQLPATEAYCRRIRTAAADQSGFETYLAHHYTRYLGDLSGGQIIAVLLKRHYGAGDSQTTFFRFPGIDSPQRFKRQYRLELDELGFTEPQIERVLDEVREAFRSNSEVFAELAAPPAG